MDTSDSYKDGGIIKPGDVNRSVLTIEHMLKTKEFGLQIYDHLPQSIKKDLPIGYRNMLDFALWHHDISKTLENGWTNDLLLGKRHPTAHEWNNVILPHPEKAAEKAGILLIDQCRADIEIITICEIIRLHHVRYDKIPIKKIIDNGSEGIPMPRYGGYPEVPEAWLNRYSKNHPSFQT